MNIKSFLGLNHLWPLTYIVIYRQLFTYLIKFIDDLHRIFGFNAKSLHCTDNTFASIRDVFNSRFCYSCLLTRDRSFLPVSALSLFDYRRRPEYIFILKLTFKDGWRASIHYCIQNLLVTGSIYFINFI